MFRIIRSFLFLFNAETAHNLTLKLLNLPFVSKLLKLFYHYEKENLKCNIAGLNFKNPVGLAAGLDKNAECIDALADLGFGFIEIGTVTPRAQDGNPKPRLFRLKEDEAIINRMGFNNDGVEGLIPRLRKRKSTLLIGGNIGKNKITDNHKAMDDYLYSFNKLFDYVNYFVVNVSSPNTPNLRDLQEKEPLTKLLKALQEENHLKKNPKAIFLKIAPDLTETQLDDIINIVEETGITGLIATNTTISRENLKSGFQKEAGGLSGKPLTDKSTQVIRYIREKAQSEFPIIAVGGIMTAEDAIEKFKAGANLVQIYTGFIYKGPALIREIKKSLHKMKKN